MKRRGDHPVRLHRQRGEDAAVQGGDPYCRTLPAPGGACRSRGVPHPSEGAGPPGPRRVADEGGRSRAGLRPRWRHLPALRRHDLRPPRASATTTGSRRVPATPTAAASASGGGCARARTSRRASAARRSPRQESRSGQSPAASSTGYLGNGQETIHGAGRPMGAEDIRQRKIRRGAPDGS